MGFFRKRILPALLILSLFSGCSSVKSQVKTRHRSPEELYAEGQRYYSVRRYEDAEKVLKAIMKDYPLSPYAPRAELLLADTAYRAERYDDARAHYTNFVALHPAHPRAAYALFQKGMCYFKEVLSLDRDQTSTRKALFVFEDLRMDYPDSPYAEKAREFIIFLKRRLAEREFYIGRFYFKSKNYRGALARFREVLDKYPDAGLADRVLYYIGEAYTRLGEEALARKAFGSLVKDYPESPFVRQARKHLGG